MADEPFGVIDGNKNYSHHAVARIFGIADTRGECSKYVLRNMLHAGLPFMKIGRIYLINGHVFSLWIQENSLPWQAWKDADPDTKSFDEQDGDSSSGGGTRATKNGAKKRSA